jgi:two-component system, OmpR family, KDP operon response regulator KdpE
MSELPIRVLVVDDEPQIRRLLRVSLTAQGYHLIEAGTGEQALTRAAADRPDLVILDLGLPDMDGQEVVRRLREWTTVPIIVLSVRDREKDKVQAFDQGADDYVTKPFGMSELMARMRAALRHRLQTETKDPVFRSGALTVDLERRIVTVEGHEIKLTPKQYDLLRVLVAHSGKVLTHQQLLRQVWGPGYSEESQYLRVYVGQLRQKIEPDPTRPTYILTESGVGYRLCDADEATGA